MLQNRYFRTGILIFEITLDFLSKLYFRILEEMIMSANMTPVTHFKFFKSVKYKEFPFFSTWDMIWDNIWFKWHVIWHLIRTLQYYHLQDMANNVAKFNQFASEAVYTRKILRTFKHAFRFVCLWSRDLSTRHVLHAIVAPDLGSRFGGPGQKALQTLNEFTLFVDFCLIPLSKTCSFDKPAKNL